MNDRGQRIDGVRRRIRACVLAALISGCAETSPPEPADPPSSSASAAVESQESPPAPSVQLRTVDRAEFDEQLAGLDGKVVLVDFWATWCGPCLEQLPHTFALAQQHRDAGLAVATVCMEDAEKESAIARALASRGADENSSVLNLVSREGGGPAAMEAFEIPGGALPHYRVYDRAGKLRHEFSLDPLADEQFTHEDVAAAVETLLDE